MNEHEQGLRPPSRTPVPGAVMAAAVVVLCAGWLFKAHCYLDGAWSDGEEYTTGCYTDVVPFWTARDVAAGGVPYVDTPLEYPVLTGAQIWIEGAISRTLVGADGTALAFLATVTAVNAALALGVLVLLHRAGVPRQRLWWWALAPPLLLYVGHNWDLLAIFLMVLAIDRHRSGRDLEAGAAVGLGTAAKLFPALLLPLLLLTRVRGGDLGAAGRTLGGAAAAWLVVNVPVAVLAPQRWGEFYTFSQERLGTFAASWTIVDEAGLVATSVEQRNLGATLLFLIGAAAIVRAGWHRHTGREWVLLTPLIAWFLLTNKVYSPQFDLWLVPLLVLTARRLWPLAAFIASDVLVYWAEFWYLGWRLGVTPAVPYPVLAAAGAVRAAALLCVIVFAVRDAAPDWLTPSPPLEARRAATVSGADSS